MSPPPAGPAPSFACRRCGACCRWPGSVLLEPGDVAAAAAALGMAETDFIARHTVLARNRAQLSLREAPGGACEFLGAGNYCRIHAARPRQCREFPLGWQVAGCPGLDPRAGQNGRVFHCVENAGGPTMRAACGRFPTK